MGKPSRTVLIGGVLVLVVGAMVGIAFLIASGSRTTGAQGRDPTPSASTTSSVAATVSDTETRGGDIAPHEVENRSGLVPKDLTPEARLRLEKEAARVEAVLEPLRASGKVIPESVRQALVDLGYPADQIQAERRKPGVVFGVPAPGGCLQGVVYADKDLVSVSAAGPSVEWGCAVPGPTH